MHKPHITPQSFYDDQVAASARYVAWINAPRERTTEPVEFLPKAKPTSKKQIILATI